MLATLAPTGMTEARGALAGADPPPAALAPGRPVRAGPGRPDLPDLGADLRLQPGVRALPQSSSGRRDPRELTTAECKAVIDELQAIMQVFYVNIGGGEPTVTAGLLGAGRLRVAHQVGVKFSTNGIRIDAGRAERLAATDYVDVQISLDGATAEVNDAVRGEGSYDTAIRAMENLLAAGLRDVQDLGRLHAAQRRPARRVQGDRRSLRRPAAAHPAAAVGPRGRRLGRAAPDCRTSSASSTTGWSRTATTCSPATRSSTCRRWGTRCPA